MAHETQSLAWLNKIGCGALLIGGFGATLPATEGMVLRLTNTCKKTQNGALKNNAKATNGLILLFQTPEMTNKMSQNQMLGHDWPGGRFTQSWAITIKGKQSYDTMANLELNDVLRKVGLQRKEDPKDVLAQMTALE